MSLAGFSGALADKGGPYRTRAATLGRPHRRRRGRGGARGIGRALSAGRRSVRPASWPWRASLGRAYGSAGASVGAAALNIFVISLGYPASSPHDALVRGAFVVVGGVWAMAVALVIWPLRPYRPVRLAVAGAYRAVGDYADEVARSVARADRDRSAPGAGRARGSPGRARDGAARPSRRKRAGRAARGPRRDGGPAVRIPLRSERRRRHHPPGAAPPAGAGRARRHGARGGSHRPRHRRGHGGGGRVHPDPGRLGRRRGAGGASVHDPTSSASTTHDGDECQALREAAAAAGSRGAVRGGGVPPRWLA